MTAALQGTGIEEFVKAIVPTDEQAERAVEDAASKARFAEQMRGM